jgi:hypothetical protein
MAGWSGEREGAALGSPDRSPGRKQSRFETRCVGRRVSVQPRGLKNRLQ